MRLRYADFYEEQLEVKGWKKSELPGKAKKLGYELTIEQVYEFFEGKHCPRAGTAAIFEEIFEVQLRPKYYGVGQVYKVSA